MSMIGMRKKEITNKWRKKVGTCSVGWVFGYFVDNVVLNVLRMLAAVRAPPAGMVVHSTKGERPAHLRSVSVVNL